MKSNENPLMTKFVKDVTPNELWISEVNKHKKKVSWIKLWLESQVQNTIWKKYESEKL